MNDNEEKKIQDWKNKLHDAFGDQKNLYTYLFNTLDNFYYRWLEKELTTSEIAPKVYGAVTESNMMDALKRPNPAAKAGIIEAAKANKDGRVRFGLWVEVKELTQDRGSMTVVSEINWDYPSYQDASKKLSKRVKFEYDDFAVFRKQLALKLEEASELFA
jgi:hypothetical protein